MGSSNSKASTDEAKQPDNESDSSKGGVVSNAEFYTWYHEGNELYVHAEFRKAIEAFDKAIENYSKNADIDLKDEVDSWFQKGNAYYQLHEFRKAIESYDQAIKLNPNEAQYWYKIGDAYYQLHEFKKAIESYDRPIKLNPNDAQNWNKSGEMYCKVGDFKKAIESFDRAIRLEPNDADFWNKKGDAYSQLNELEYALKNYDQAIILKTNSADYWNKKGVICSKLEEFGAALECFDQAIKLSPELKYKVWLNRIRRHKYSRHDNSYEIKELNITRACYWCNKGRMHYELSEYKKAKEAYTQAIELNPKNSEYWNDRGIATIKLKEYKLAIADLDQAIILNNGDANYWRNRGDAYYGLNEYKKAEEDYDQAKEIDTDVDCSTDHLQDRKKDELENDINILDKVKQLLDDHMEEEAKTLIKKINVNKSTQKGIDLLQLALSSGQSNVAAFLIRNSSTLNAVRLNTNQYSLWNDYSLNTLMHNGANINSISDSGQLLINEYIKSAQFDKFLFLLNNGAEVNARDSYGNAPLYYAVVYNRLDFARELLNHGADINAVNYKGTSPFYLAACQGNKDILELFISHGADIMQECKNGTILSCLVDAYQKSIEKEKSIHFSDKYTILHYAAESGDLFFIRLILLARPELLKFCTERNKNLLLLAAKNDHWDIFHYFEHCNPSDCISLQKDKYIVVKKDENSKIIQLLIRNKDEKYELRVGEEKSDLDETTVFYSLNVDKIIKYIKEKIYGFNLAPLIDPCKFDSNDICKILEVGGVSSLLEKYEHDYIKNHIEEKLKEIYWAHRKEQNWYFESNIIPRINQENLASNLARDLGQPYDKILEILVRRNINYYDLDPLCDYTIPRVDKPLWHSDQSYVYKHPTEDSSSIYLNLMRKINDDCEKKLNEQDINLASGCALYRSNKFNEAIKYFDTVIKDNPNDARPFYLRALTKIKLDDNQRALEDLNRLIENHNNVMILNPPFNIERINSVCYHRALIKYAMKDFKGALDDFNLAVVDIPYCPELYYKRGNIKLYNHEIENASNDYDISFSLCPNNLKTIKKKLMVDQRKSDLQFVPELDFNQLNEEQMDIFLQQSVKHREDKSNQLIDWSDWRTYKSVLNKCPYLINFAHSKYFLNLLVNVLPKYISTMEQINKSDYLKTKILKELLNSWLDDMSERLAKDFNKKEMFIWEAKKRNDINFRKLNTEQLRAVEKDFIKNALLKYHKSLALIALKCSRNSNRKKNKVSYPFREEDTLNNVVLEPNISEKAYFQTPYEVDLIRLIRSCGLLKIDKKGYQFIDESLINLLTDNFGFAGRKVLDKSVYSVISTNKKIDYDNWVVSFVLDKKSQHPDHCYILVEGMNSYGHLIFHRYDLSLKKDGINVPNGKAAIVIAPKVNVPSSEHWKALTALIRGDDPDPNQARDRGPLSLNGFSWEITRDAAKLLDQDIKKDQDKLLNFQFLGCISVKPDDYNCYTWSREKLFKLNDERINEKLHKGEKKPKIKYPPLILNQSPDKANSEQEHPSMLKTLILDYMR